MTVLFWIIFAVLTAIVANNKNRNTVGWFILGFLFGIFALIVVALLPSLEAKDNG
jgi:hypothetical protein